MLGNPTLYEVVIYFQKKFNLISNEKFEIN